VDVKNGEPVPRKSILKSRSRENSVCSDTSESSATDLEERRLVAGRSLSHDEPLQHSDASDGLTEEDSPPSHPPSRFQVPPPIVHLYLEYSVAKTRTSHSALVVTN